MEASKSINQAHWRHLHESAELARKAATRAEQHAEDIAWWDQNPAESFTRQDVDKLAGEVAEMISWGMDVLVGIEEAGFKLDRKALQLDAP